MFKKVIKGINFVYTYILNFIIKLFIPTIKGNNSCTGNYTLVGISLPKYSMDVHFMSVLHIHKNMYFISNNLSNII